MRTFGFFANATSEDDAEITSNVGSSRMECFTESGVFEEVLNAYM